MSDARRGRGRPSNDKIAIEVWYVWSYVRECEAKGDNRQTALWRAEERFKLKRATLEKRLWLVEQVGVLVAHLRRNAPEEYEKVVERLVQRGWFGDDDLN